MSLQGTLTLLIPKARNYFVIDIRAVVKRLKVLGKSVGG